MPFLRTEMTFRWHFSVPLEDIPTSSRAAFIGSELTDVFTALSSEDIRSDQIFAQRITESNQAIIFSCRTV